MQTTITDFFQRREGSLTPKVPFFDRRWERQASWAVTTSSELVVRTNLSAPQTCDGVVKTSIFNQLTKLTGHNSVFNCPIPELLELSKPSPFGRGEQTLVDDTVRSGREICSTEDDEEIAYSDLNCVIAKELFSTRDVKLRFYKLAIYEAGGKRTFCQTLFLHRKNLCRSFC